MRKKKMGWRGGKVIYAVFFDADMITASDTVR